MQWAVLNLYRFQFKFLHFIFHACDLQWCGTRTRMPFLSLCAIYPTCLADHEYMHGTGCIMEMQCFQDEVTTGSISNLDNTFKYPPQIMSAKCAIIWMMKKILLKIALLRFFPQKKMHFWARKYKRDNFCIQLSEALKIIVVGDSTIYSSISEPLALAKYGYIVGENNSLKYGGGLCTHCIRLFGHDTF